MADDSITFTITNSEYMMLLVMMGYATGAASQQDQALFRSFLRLANSINKDNPKWIPYEVPEE
jgi:uncharacterized protein YfaT (DUF1175 family)